MITTRAAKKKKKKGNINLSYFNKVLKKKIKYAFAKYAGIDTGLLKIRINEDGIILDGIITNPYQKDDADFIMNLLLKGTMAIENNLKLETEYLDAEDFK